MLVVSPSVSVMNWEEGRKMEIAQIASHTTRMETPKKWVKRWSQGVRGPISAVKGVPSFALRRGKATLPRKPSREETPMRSPTC